MLELNIYRNTNDQSEAYNKYYSRVALKEVMYLEDLSKHMSEHNTPFSAGVIGGVLTDMVKCIRELCLEGKVIKIPNLALFKCSVESNGQAALYTKQKGAIRAAIGAKNTTCSVKNVKLLAQSTGEFIRDSLNDAAQLKWSDTAQALIDAAEQAANS